MKIVSIISNSLLALRTRLGLSQQQVAIELGVSLSTIKMVETNKRTLSSDKLVLLAALEIRLASVEPVNKKDMSPNLQKLYSRVMDSLEKETIFRRRHCSLKATQMEKKLKKIKADYQQLTSNLKNLEAINVDHLDPSDPFVNTLRHHRAKLEHKLLKCNPHVQQVMNNKIALLHTEAALNNSIQAHYVHKNEKPSQKQILSQQKQTKMDYTVSLITSQADCQVMINMANDDKASLEYRKTGLQRQNQSASTSSISVETELAAVTAELNALQTVYAGVPEGPTKVDTEGKIKKAEYRKFLLEKRKSSYGSIALMERQFDIACLERSITEAEAFIQALTTRLNELPSA